MDNPTAVYKLHAAMICDKAIAQGAKVMSDEAFRLGVGWCWSQLHNGETPDVQERLRKIIEDGEIPEDAELLSVDSELSEDGKYIRMKAPKEKV